MTVCIQEQTTRFTHDKFIQDLAGALMDGFAAGGIEVLGSGVELLCQDADLSLEVRTGEQEVNESGVKLCLYAGVQEAVTTLFQQEGYQAFEESVDAVMLERAFPEGLYLYVLVRADLIFCWNMLFQ